MSRKKTEDFVKNNIWYVGLIICSCLIFGCTTQSESSQRTIPSLGLNVASGANQSEVVVHFGRLGVPNVLLDIIMNGEVVAQIDANSSEMVIIPNGRHSIMIRTSLGRTSNTVNFTADSKRIVFTVIPRTGGVGGYRISRTSTYDLGISQATRGTREMQEALNRSVDQLITRLPAGSIIAIVYVTSNDYDITEYIANELEFLMVNRNIMVVDRIQLDRIRAEQELQLSDEIDDDTAVSIGEIAGANIIITGSITGSGDLRRLRIRAIDTETSQVVGVVSESVIN